MASQSFRFALLIQGRGGETIKQFCIDSGARIEAPGSELGASQMV